jgi:adenine-specific DNA-methyltransferase
MTKEIICGDSLTELRKIYSGTVSLILTSPPYNIGKEYERKQPIEIYIEWIKLQLVEFSRVLTGTGSIAFQVGNYVNKGCVYPLDCLLFNEFITLGFKPRNRIVWHFGHGLHCKKRFSGRHETILWFTKSENYTFNLDPVRVPSKYPEKKHYKGDKKGQLSGNPLGKNPSDIWDIPNVKNNHPEKTKHQCQFPEKLASNIILSLTNMGDLILDPFCGSGTTLKIANDNSRQFIGIDNSEEYIKITKNRLTTQP